MICTEPCVHTFLVVVADHENEILRPMRVFWRLVRTVPKPKLGTVRFRNDAKERTVATPRILGAPWPSSIQLSHVALMTIASDPDARGDVDTAYEFTPDLV
jgi:hypothetical protein